MGGTFRFVFTTFLLASAKGSKIESTLASTFPTEADINAHFREVVNAPQGSLIPYEAEEECLEYPPLFAALYEGFPHFETWMLMSNHAVDINKSASLGSNTEDPPLVFLLKQYNAKPDPSLWTKRYATLLRLVLEKGALPNIEIQGKPALTYLSFPRDLPLIQVYTQHSTTGLLSLLSRDIPDDPAVFSQNMQWLPQFYRLLESNLSSTSRSSQKKYLPQIKQKLHDLLANETLDAFAKAQCQRILELITPAPPAEKPVSNFTKIALSVASFIEKHQGNIIATGVTLAASGATLLCCGRKRQAKKETLCVTPTLTASSSSAAHTPQAYTP